MTGNRLCSSYRTHIMHRLIRKLIWTRLNLYWRGNPRQHLEWLAHSLYRSQEKRHLCLKIWALRFLTTSSLLQTKLAEATVEAQSRYKTNFDKMICQVSVYDNGDLVHWQVYSLPIDDNPSNKLKQKKFYTFIAVADTPRTITIEEDGINDSASFGRMPIARRKNKNLWPPQAYTEVAYVVGKHIGHSVASGCILYCVRWYGYSLKDKIDEPEKNLSNLFTC